MQVLSNQQVLRRTTRNAKKSYDGIIVGKPSAGVGKGGNFFSMTRAMKARKKKYLLSVISYSIIITAIKILQVAIQVVWQNIDFSVLLTL